MKNMKKFLALALSASMVMGMTLTSMAAEPEVSVDAPIYAYDITNVVVPTTYVVAFNPDKLDVIKNGDEANPIRDQIVSKNYGIINKSTKDKVITVTLKVEDLNGDKITFASDPADVTSAAADDYVVNLTLVPADADEVKVGAASAGLTTTGADLADVTMAGATSSAKALVAGENEVDFLLEKAKYTGKINLESAKDNNVADEFTLSSLADNGKGITAFTFSGTMNEKADWTKLTKGIKITAIYSNENAADGATAVTGTGALYENPYPVFKTGAEVGTIKYKSGTENDAIQSINKIEMDYGGTIYDGYHALGTAWSDANDEDGIITLPEKFMANFISKYPNDTVKEATVYYTTVGGVDKTATVDVKLRKPISVAPAFTMGTEIGTINYTVGTGEDALDTITKIEMDYAGVIYDGYNANGTSWTAAADTNGKITLPAKYMDNFKTKYPSDSTREATITYVTTGGATKTATVDIKLK